MTRLWLSLLAVSAVALGSVAFMQAGSEQPAAPPLAAPVDGQPIAFPHDVHAGANQIDCQYCHFSAERSVDAGIPPVSSCMGCHLLVGGTTDQAQAEIAKVRDYYNNGQPIPWQRIYKVSDHVHFPHLRHVAADVECQTCHGEVQEMGVIESVNQPLAMGWCVTCHRENEAGFDCTVCHY